MVRDNIFFSIIIPTFNQGDYLEKCIMSCLNQTYKNYEIIIVDNHSQDKTNDILNKYYKKIIFKKIDNRGIISKSRNLALSIAKGNWIAFLDSDDYFFSTKLEEAKTAIINHSFDAFFSSELIGYQGSDDKKIWFYGNKKKNFYLDLIKYGSNLSTSASIVKREFINNNLISFSETENIKNVADYDFFLKIAKARGKFFFYKKPLGFHLMHQSSTTSKSQDSYFFAIKNVLNDHLNSKYINKKIYYFALLNLKVMELISNKDLSRNKKIYLLIKYFIKNPLIITFITIRIFEKKIKNIILNFYINYILPNGKL